MHEVHVPPSSTFYVLPMITVTKMFSFFVHVAFFVQLYFRSYNGVTKFLTIWTHEVLPSVTAGYMTFYEIIRKFDMFNFSHC